MFPGAPYNTRPSSKDVALSFHHPSTPYGFGLSIALVYTSSSINLPTPPGSAESLDAMLNSSACPPISLLFGPESLVAASLYSQLLTKMVGDASFIIRRARTGKLALLRKGVLSRETFWDKLLFNGVRKDAGLDSIRGIIISGAVEQSKLDLFRLVLGSPVVSTLEHKYSLSPITASLMWDIQRLPPPFKAVPDGNERGQVGAPTAGTEIKFQVIESEIIRGRIRGEASDFSLSVTRTYVASIVAYSKPRLISSDDFSCH